MSKRFITFETVSKPIDSELEQLAVKPIFEQIIQNLTNNGTDLIEPPTEWDSYGWHALFQFGSTKLTCVMQRSDSWLLIISNNRSLMDRLKGRHYELELSEFASLAVIAVQAATGVPVRLFETEEDFLSG